MPTNQPIQCCPGTLADGYNTFSPTCLRRMFAGKKVDHLLPYEQPQLSEDVQALFLDNRKWISISGVQEKLSLILDKNKLRLTRENEQGQYILKPIPRDLKKIDQVPANEHLTMQIARQVYGIQTAENALVFFKNGSPAYLTKRFDLNETGTKWGIEDFASLAGKTTENAGPNFKYDYSYEEVGLLIQKYVPAWRVEIEKYFTIVLFNFLFSNGDAHLKNFSLLETTQGDYLLSPAYDLLNTKLHVDDSDFALDKGLFKDDFKSEQYKIRNHPHLLDFIEFGKRIGVREDRIEKLIAPLLQTPPLLQQLISNSFLNTANKRGYLMMYQAKRNFLMK